MNDSIQHSLPGNWCPVCESAHEDRYHVERVLKLAEHNGRWHLGGLDIGALRGLLKQYQTAREALVVIARGPTAYAVTAEIIAREALATLDGSNPASSYDDLVEPPKADSDVCHNDAQSPATSRCEKCKHDAHEPEACGANVGTGYQGAVLCRCGR